MTISPEHEKILSERGLDIELLDRLGLSSTQREGGSALVIPFNREGRTVRRKYRSFTGERKWTADKGGIRCPFNEDCLRDEGLLSQPLIITEGELDAIAAIQSGFQRTISVPDGAPAEPIKEAGESKAYAWVADIRPLLAKDRVPVVILATDGDDPGAALRHDLSHLLGRYRCKVLTYPLCKKDRGRERCKDLNEVLEDHGPAGVTATINRAQWIKLDGVYRMGELPTLPPMTIYEPRRHRLFAENFKCRMGDFSVVTGTPGSGKSTFMNDIFCGIAMDEGVTIAWASFEQQPQVDHKRSLRAWFGAEIRESIPYGEMIKLADRWIDERHVFLIPGEDEDADLDWLVERMEQAVVRYGARIIVVDPWNELEHGFGQGESETLYTSRAIRKLKRFARAFQVHICVVAHPKKIEKFEGVYVVPTLYDIAGSANWFNKADLGLVVHRQTDEVTLVKVQKSRYHDTIGKPGEVLMHFNMSERRFIETERPS